MPTSALSLNMSSLYILLSGRRLEDILFLYSCLMLPLLQHIEKREEKRIPTYMPEAKLFMLTHAYVTCYSL